MAVKKGFLHITEIIIVVLLIFVVLFQFNMIPMIETQWGDTKLLLMAYDLLYSFKKLGLNWFDPYDTADAISLALNNTAGFSLKTMQEIRPITRVGCVCDEENFTILKNEILTDFTLNGIRRSFTVERISPESLHFSVSNDVIVFWGSPVMGGNDFRRLEEYVKSGRGVVEFSALSEDKAKEAWHEDIFNLVWVEETDSVYVRSQNAYFSPITPTDAGYGTWKLFYHTPYELSPELSTAAYWKMNDGDGTARDTSGKENDGILYSGVDSCAVYDVSVCPLWVDGKTGTALNFDGSEDFVLVNDDNTLDFGTGSFTVEAWIRTEDTEGPIVYKWDTSDGWEFSLRLSELQMEVMDEGSSSYLVRTINTGINDGSWHLATAVVDRPNERIDLYVDGSYKGGAGTPIIGSLDNDNDLFIGGIPTGTIDSQFFDGDIDEVVIYSRVLTPGEIESHYERVMDSKTHEFSNFASENVSLGSKSASAVIVEQETRYTGGSHDGESVPLAVVNWGVRGSGRTAWVSSAPLEPDNKHLLKSLVMWASSGNEYGVSGGEIKEGVRSVLYTVLNRDMYEPVRVDLTVGYHF